MDPALALPRCSALGTLVLIGCLFPADESHTVFVTIDNPTRIVSRGGDLTVRAQAWTNTSDGSVRSLEGATFTWSSTDSTIATILSGPAGRATITGVRSGVVRIVARPDQFAEAAAGETEIRVANTVEIDSVAPDSVRFGEQITVHGVGLDRIERAFLGDAILMEDNSSFTGDSAGVGTLRFWVPFPATSQRLLAAVAEGFSASSPDSVIVIPEDLYETWDPSPVTISLDGPVIRQPAVLFYNPALSIEGTATPEDDAPATDRFVFTRSTISEPLTVIVRAAVLPLGQFEAAIEPLPEPEFFEGWSIGVQTQSCEFSRVTTGTRTDSVVRLVEASASGSFRLQVAGERGGYAIEVRSGEPAGEPSIPADRFEYNDHCRAALRNFDDEARRIDLAGGAFSEELTIHRPFDIDWYEFQTSADLASLLSIRLVPLPFGVADSSDLDLYYAESVDTSSSATPSSSHEFIQVRNLSTEARLRVMVIDKAGVPTRYSLCISMGIQCAVGSSPTAESLPAASKSPKEVVPALTRAYPGR